MSNKIIHCKQDLLMKSLSDFFYKKKNIDIMLPIINSKSNISLRIIDWFVTNYSKKKNILYNLQYVKNKQPNIIRFVVYLNYKAQLKAYSKKQFDPFCRRDRISFFYEDDKELTTTVGQLNFFRWAIEHKVLNYIIDNLKDIEDDMNKCVRNIYTKKKNYSEITNDNSNNDIIIDTKKFNIQLSNNQSKTRKKRHELSLSATRSINKHDIQITVQFE